MSSPAEIFFPDPGGRIKNSPADFNSAGENTVSEPEIDKRIIAGAYDKCNAHGEKRYIHEIHGYGRYRALLLDVQFTGDGEGEQDAGDNEREIKELRHVAGQKRRPAGGHEAEHHAYHMAELSEVRLVKQHPADYHEQHRINPLYGGGQLLERLAPQKLFAQEQDCVVQTPENEVPLRAVPEAGERPDDENVQYPARGLDPIPAERDIYVVAEPA